MTSRDGWVASDATKYSLKNKRPDWVSLVSVAVAVDDISQFNRDYRSIVKNNCQKFGIKTQHPLIKNHDINRWGNDWKRQEIRRDIITELLSIESIDTIQITETSLHSRWVTIFKDEKNKMNDVRSEDFIDKYLQPYYNLISIWEYLRKSDARPRTHRNVVTDDFSGKNSPAWMEIGEMSDELKVIPKGDKTYPLLSIADLLMEFVKQEVTDWNEDEIYRFLKKETPNDSAYVDSDAINGNEELTQIAPDTTHNINTTLHYPHPIVFIDSGNIGSRKVSSTDFFDHAAKFARDNEGCVKFFDEKQDRDYVTEEDLIICIDRNTEKYEYITELNDTTTPMLLTLDEGKEMFHDEFGAYS